MAGSLPQVKLWLLGLLLLLCKLESTMVAALHNTCPEIDVQPNRMQCFNAIYTDGQCTLLPGAHLLLNTNSDEGIDFIYQPGYFQGLYQDNVICKWNIVPKTNCHNAAIILLDKRLHATTYPSLSGSNAGTNCPNKDHVSLDFSSGYNDYFCGQANHHNCPISNCLSQQGYITRNGNLTVTFRSNGNGNGAGFLAMVVNDIEISSRLCPRSTPKSFIIGRTSLLTLRPPIARFISVPPTARCTVLNYLKGPLPCECSGRCSTSSNLLNTIKSLLDRTPSDRSTFGGKAANFYVNSGNRILRQASRKIMSNIARFGTAVPTIKQRLNEMDDRMLQCPK